MSRKLAAFMIVSLVRYLHNSTIYHSEWEIVAHTANDMIMSGWMIYLIAG